MLMGYQAASMLDSGVIPTVEVSVEKVFQQRITSADPRFGHRPARPRRPVGSTAARRARGREIRTAHTGCRPLICASVAAPTRYYRDVIAQRGHGHAVLRDADGDGHQCKLLPDQDERDLASMLSALIRRRVPDKPGPRTSRRRTHARCPPGCGGSLADAGVFDLFASAGIRRRRRRVIRPRHTFCHRGRPRPVPDNRARHRAGRSGHPAARRTRSA